MAASKTALIPDILEIHFLTAAEEKEKEKIAGFSIKGKKEMKEKRQE